MTTISRTTGRWAALCLVSLSALAWLSSRSTAEPPKPVVPPVSEPASDTSPSKRPVAHDGKATPEQVLAWRKKYPFQSLAGRLDYEAERAPKASPPMKPSVSERLELEPHVGGSYLGAVRGESFRMLHEETVEEFVSKSDLFGISRLPRAERGPRYYELPEAKPIPLAKVAESSDEGPVLELPATRDAARAAGGATRLMPTFNDAQWMHWAGTSNFVDRASFGYVKNIDAVVGFSSHRFRGYLLPPVDHAQPVPQTGPAQNPKYWRLARLELVSLLKHASPRVYLSDNLPRMDELTSHRTRELSTFEADSLAKLNAGDDLAVSAKANRIEMLGALRAGKSCRQCHEVPQGTILGAFSYDLRRDPPIKNVSPATAEQ
jgi:hypothetical protein